jgi:2,4-dichlorophenol 6-monooxygenase
VEAAAKASDVLRLDIQVHVIGPGQPYVDTYGDFALAMEVEESGALLVRPDMFIGWRAGDASASSLDELLIALRSLLARD